MKADIMPNKVNIKQTQYAELQNLTWHKKMFVHLIAHLQKSQKGFFA